MVTVEAAVVLLAVVLVLAGCLWGLAVGDSQLRVDDAAGLAARAAARGEADDRVRAVALSAAPDGARVVVERSQSSVAVTVVRTVTGPGLLGRLSTTVRRRAVAAREDAVVAVSP
ncbi:hypothetical protein CLV35_1818 [Motilibacter peucedani]|uniref:TadE-like protein n=2 Tax=Motilibacter peucedani TaxID=598650 RepID=A0A420XQ46_9ACTN|nr:hypothetical protein CLV35_1818 [Motilibacter peucedani]